MSRRNRSRKGGRRMNNQAYSRKSDQVRTDAKKIERMLKGGRRMTTNQIAEELNRMFPSVEHRSIASVYRSCKLFKEEDRFNYIPKGKTWGLGVNIDNDVLTKAIFAAIDACGKPMTARDINDALDNGKDKKKCDNVMRVLQVLHAKKQLSRSIDRPYKYFKPAFPSSSPGINRLSLQKLKELIDNIIITGQTIKQIVSEIGT